LIVVGAAENIILGFHKSQTLGKPAFEGGKEEPEPWGTWGSRGEKSRKGGGKGRAFSWGFAGFKKEGTWVASKEKKKKKRIRRGVWGKTKMGRKLNREKAKLKESRWGHQRAWEKKKKKEVKARGRRSRFLLWETGGKLEKGCKTHPSHSNTKRRIVAQGGKRKQPLRKKKNKNKIFARS